MRLLGRYENRDVGRILSEIDVLVVPSLWWENSPITIHEAFLAGVPVVASDQGGMAELVQDGKNGFLFKIGDAADLARVLLRFVADPALVTKLRPRRESIRDIREDALWTEDQYRRLIAREDRGEGAVRVVRLPARPSRGGTDVHAHALGTELRRLGHEVAVFCREGDAGRPDFQTRSFEVDGIPVVALNYNFGDAADFSFIHRNARIEDAFVAELERVRPDVVHVHHLTCLSTGMLDRVAERGIPLVMTLHDFWMVCGRGQRIRKELEVCEDLDRERCAPCLQDLWPHFAREITPDRLRGVDADVRARLLRCDALISPSGFHRDRMLEFGLDPARLHVVEHGLAAAPRRLSRAGRPRADDRLRRHR